MDREISVLLVEDSPTQAEFIRSLLENNGVKTTVSENGQEALSTLRVSRPTLVLSDIRMPGMDGYELCAAIRSDKEMRDLPVVLLTSLSSPTDIIRALECGADNFITKPCNEDQLFSIINGIVESIRLGMELTDVSGNEIIFKGERYYIKHERRRVISLLISTYESAVNKNRELRESQEKLINLNRQLKAALIEKSHAVKLSEESLEKLYQKEAVIKQWHDELVLVHGIESLINHACTDAELFSMICGKLMAAGFFGIARHAKVCLLQDNTISCCYDTKGEDSRLVCTEIPFGERVCSRSISSGQIKIMEHTAVGYSCPEVSTDNGRIAIPLLAKEKRVGILCFALDAGTDLDDRQLDLLASLGRQMGMSLENLRLFRETEQLSLKDPLTGLANRRMLEIDYSKCVARSQRYGIPFSFLLIDIDHFKKYNDTYGHDSGDQILVKTAEVLNSNLRNTDLAVRYGGEEFILLVSDSSLANALHIAERARQSVSEVVNVTVSIGVAEHLPGDSLDMLLKKADIQLYKAKEGGRDRIEPCLVARGG